MKSQFPLTIVSVSDRALAILFLVVAFSAAMAERPMEAFLWTWGSFLYFCACYQQARAEHYKMLFSNIAEELLKRANEKDHS